MFSDLFCNISDVCISDHMSYVRNITFDVFVTSGSVTYPSSILPNYEEDKGIMTGDKE